MKARSVGYLDLPLEPHRGSIKLVKIALAIWRVDGGDPDGVAVESDALHVIELAVEKVRVFELCTFAPLSGPVVAAPGCWAAAGRLLRTRESNNGTRRIDAADNEVAGDVEGGEGVGVLLERGARVLIDAVGAVVSGEADGVIVKRFASGVGEEKRCTLAESLLEADLDGVAAGDGSCNDDAAHAGELRIGRGVSSLNSGSGDGPAICTCPRSGFGTEVNS